MKLLPVKALSEFEEDMLKRNFSPETIKLYKSYVMNFFRFLLNKEDHDLRGVTREDVLKYRQWIEDYRTRKGRPYSHGSKELSVKCLKYFFKYLKRKNLILIDPSQALPHLKTIKSFPKCILTRKEMTRILTRPNLKTRVGYRDRTIMEILYSTAIRNKELINLSIYDLDLEHGMIRVNQGKGKKDRVVPVGKTAVNYLKEYLSEIRPKILKENFCKKLFINQYGKPLTGADLTKQIKRYSKMANLDKPVTPHSFRHTCATEMLRGGSSIRYVQAMLGHARIRSTQVYTRVVPIDLKKVIRKYHPRERQKKQKIIPFNIKDAKFYNRKKKGNP